MNEQHCLCGGVLKIDGSWGTCQGCGFVWQVVEESGLPGIDYWLKLPEPDLVETFVETSLLPAIVSPDVVVREVMTAKDKVLAAMWSLRVLDIAGLDETPAADAIRDASEEFWNLLTESEKEECRNVLPR